MTQNSLDTIITKIGGDGAVALGLSISEDAIRKWRVKGYIPPSKWPRIVEMTGGKVSYKALDALWRSVQSAEAA